MRGYKLLLKPAIVEIIRNTDLSINNEKLTLNFVDEWILYQLHFAMSKTGLFSIHLPKLDPKLLAIICLELAYSTRNRFLGKYYNLDEPAIAIIFTPNVIVRNNFLSIECRNTRICDINYGVGYIGRNGQIKKFGNCKATIVKLIYCTHVNYLEKVNEKLLNNCIAFIIDCNKISRLKIWQLEDNLRLLFNFPPKTKILLTDIPNSYNITKISNLYNIQRLSFFSSLSEEFRKPFVDGISISAKTLDNLYSKIQINVISFDWEELNKFNLEVNNFTKFFVEFRNTEFKRTFDLIRRKIYRILNKISNLLSPMSFYDKLAYDSNFTTPIIVDLQKLQQFIVVIKLKFPSNQALIFSNLEELVNEIQNFVIAEYNSLYPKCGFILEEIRNNVLNNSNSENIAFVFNTKINRDSFKLFLQTTLRDSTLFNRRISLLLSNDVNKINNFDQIYWYGFEQYDIYLSSRALSGIANKENFLVYNGYQKSRIYKLINYKKEYFKSFRKEQNCNFPFIVKNKSVSEQKTEELEREDINILAEIKNHLLQSFKTDFNDLQELKQDYEEEESRKIDDEFSFLLSGGFIIHCTFTNRGNKEIRVPFNKKVLTIQFDESKPKAVLPEKLRIGDLILLFNGEVQTNLTEKILKKLYEDPVWKVHVQIRDIWVRSIRKVTIDNEISVEDIKNQLKTKGSKIDNIGTIKKWISGQTIGPRDLTDIIRFADIYKLDNLKENFKPISMSIKELQSIRNRIRLKIIKQAKSELQMGRNVFKNSKSEFNYEKETLLEEDFQELIELLRIEDIQKIKPIFQEDEN